MARRRGKICVAGRFNPVTRHPPAYTGILGRAAPVDPECRGLGFRASVLPPEELRALMIARDHLRVDSGRGQDRTLRGKVPVECTKDGWS